jgi:hypothetical protein
MLGKKEMKNEGETRGQEIYTKDSEICHSQYKEDVKVGVVPEVYDPI